MTPALRLVVVWMVGVLVLGVAWSRHALMKDAQMVVIAPAPAPATVVDAPRDAIARYLRVRYDGFDGGLSYGDPPLIEIDNPALRRFLPDTRFFATELLPGVAAGLISWQVDLLVSFRRAEGHDDIRSWPPDIIDGSAQRFLSQLLGVSASTLVERRELALALAELLAATTEHGWARSSSCFKDTHAELWRGREHWRDILVLGSNDRVSRIAIWNEIDQRVEARISSY